jgi:hypothetical protein
MAYNLVVGVESQLSFSIGIPTDYSYTLSAPSKATVTVGGKITGVAIGLVTITVTRISDNTIVGNVLIDVTTSGTSSTVISVTAIPPTTLSIDFSIAGLMHVMWTNADVTTPIAGFDVADQASTGSPTGAPVFLVLNHPGNTDSGSRTVLLPYGSPTTSNKTLLLSGNSSGDIWIPSPGSNSSQTWNLCTQPDAYSPDYPDFYSGAHGGFPNTYGPIQASVVGTDLSGSPLSGATITQVGVDIHVSWTNTAYTALTHYSLMLDTVGTPVLVTDTNASPTYVFTGPFTPGSTTFSVTLLDNSDAEIYTLVSGIAETISLYTDGTFSYT